MLTTLILALTLQGTAAPNKARIVFQVLSDLVRMDFPLDKESWEASRKSPECAECWTQTCFA